MKIALTTLQHQPQSPYWRKRSTLLLILLALLITTAIGTGLLLTVLRHGSSPSTIQGVTHSHATPTPRLTVTPVASPPSTLTPGAVDTSIAASYSATVFNLITNA